MTRGKVTAVAVALVASGWAVSVDAAVDAPAAVPVAVSTWTGRVAAGDNHTCTVRTDGTVWCWGDNQFGQLGNSQFPDQKSNVPVQVAALPGGRTAVSITAGKNHTCVLAHDGTVWCWGYNGFAEVGAGVGNQSDPVLVSLGAGITATRVVAGGNTTCAQTSDGKLTCWGRNNKGQIGIGGTQASGGVTPTAVNTIPGSLTVRDIDPGGQHMCAASDGGSAVCWGLDGQLQLGTAGDSATDKYSPVPVDSTGGSVRSVSTGDAHSCAVLGTGSVVCWGDNTHGQLARGSVSPSTSSVPTAVSLTAKTVRLASGVTHSCALTATGDLWCWGRNQAGQVGDNTVVTPRPTPLQVQSLGAEVVDVSAGLSHTCALLATGSVKCWGSNGYGQVGAADGVDRTVPTVVEGLDAASTAASLSSSAVTTDSALVSAGISVPVGETSFAVQVSSSASFASGVTTTQLGTWGRAVQVSSSSGHSCAVLASGTVSCNGSNTNGQLGNGTNSGSAVPVNVLLDERALSVSTGTDHSCAVMSSGSVRCWGANERGQLGNGTTTASNVPVTVSLGAGEHAVAVSAGSTGTCALIDSGAVRCWGDNTHGGLGNGNTTPTLSLVTVALGGEAAVGVSVGDDRACAALANGTARCWGAGPAGDGSSGDAPSPVLVSTSSSTVRQVSAGAGHACALLAGGTVECWGNDAVISSAAPVPVSFGAGAHVSAVASSGAATCSRLSTGSTACVGEPGDASAHATHALDPGTAQSHSSRTLSATVSGLGDGTTHWFRFVVTHSGTVTNTSASSFITLATTTTSQAVTTAPTVAPTTAPPDSVNTTSSVAATVPVTSVLPPTKKTLSVRAGRTVSASRIARSVGLYVPRRSQGVLRLSIIAGQKRCVFRGSAVFAARVGACRVRVSFIPASGRRTTTTLTISVVR